MSVRAFLFRFILLLLALLVLLGITETWVRSRLFSDDPAYKGWRDPEFYTLRYKVDGRVVVRDDHDKLAVQWGLLQPVVDGPHSLLGWCGHLDSATLLPKGFVPGSSNTGPVLLGTGWVEHAITTVAGYSPGDSTPVPLNLSVAGFSIDQDLLLFGQTRKHYRGRKLLLHIDLEDIDHLQRTFVGRPKPWYSLAIHGGELHGVPVTTDVKSYLSENPADPGLYAYHLFRTQVLHDTIMSPGAAETAEAELRELSKKLLSSLLAQAREDSIQVSVYLEQNSLGALPDRRRWALLDICREMNVPCHVLGEEAEAIGHRDQVRMMRTFLDHAAYAAGQPDYTSLSQLKNLSGRAVTELTPLERNMLTILNDERWSNMIREKAAINRASFAMMVQRDAQYQIDLGHP